MEKVQTYVLDDTFGTAEDDWGPKLIHTGERQTASTLAGIAPDHRKRYEFAAKYLTEHGVKTVIDAGCGNGYGSRILAEAGLKVTAIDVSAEAIAFARHYYRHDAIEYSVADIATFYYPKADAIVALEVVEHIADAIGLLIRFGEVAPLLIMSVPNENVTPFAAHSAPYHFRHYTPEQLAELITGAGWTIERQVTQADKWIGDIVPGTNGRIITTVARR